MISKDRLYGTKQREDTQRSTGLNIALQNSMGKWISI